MQCVINIQITKLNEFPTLHGMIHNEDSDNFRPM